MVAPIDAKATFEVEGEAVTLRLNFRTLALAKKNGVQMLSGNLDPLDLAVAVRCMAAQDHPDMTDDEAFALVIRGGDAAAGALTQLFEDFGGQAAGGNGKKAKPKS